jgi:hypothetical protein
MSKLLDRLRNEPMYKSALDNARTDAERAAIVQVVEGLVGAVAQTLEPALERIQSDPEFARELGRALKKHSDVLTNDTPAVASVTKN